MKAKVIGVRYINSETERIQGKKAKIDKYLRKGYKVLNSSFGNYVLFKPAKALVTLSNEECGERVFDMKDDICEYFSKSKITESMFDDFVSNIKDEKIVFDLDEYGNYSLNF